MSNSPVLGNPVESEDDLEIIEVECPSGKSSTKLKPGFGSSPIDDCYKGNKPRGLNSFQNSTTNAPVRHRPIYNESTSTKSSVISPYVQSKGAEKAASEDQSSPPLQNAFLDCYKRDVKPNTSSLQNIHGRRSTTVSTRPGNTEGNISLSAKTAIRKFFGERSQGLQNRKTATNTVEEIEIIDDSDDEDSPMPVDSAPQDGRNTKKPTPVSADNEIAKPYIADDVEVIEKSKEEGVSTGHTKETTPESNESESTGETMGKDAVGESRNVAKKLTPVSFDTEIAGKSTADNVEIIQESKKECVPAGDTKNTEEISSESNESTSATIGKDVTKRSSNAAVPADNQENSESPMEITPALEDTASADSVTADGIEIIKESNNEGSHPNDTENTMETTPGSNDKENTGTTTVDTENMEKPENAVVDSNTEHTVNEPTNKTTPDGSNFVGLRVKAIEELNSECISAGASTDHMREPMEISIESTVGSCPEYMGMNVTPQPHYTGTNTLDNSMPIGSYPDYLRNPMTPQSRFTPPIDTVRFDENGRPIVVKLSAGMVGNYGRPMPAGSYPDLRNTITPQSPFPPGAATITIADNSLPVGSYTDHLGNTIQVTPQPPGPIGMPYPLNTMNTTPEPHDTAPGNRKHYLCAYCKKYFATMGGWKRHQNSARCKKHTTCDECDQVFNTVAGLEHHRIFSHFNVTKQQQRTYDCSICLMTFYDEAERDDHLKTHDVRSHQPIYDCNICHMSFHDESKRDDHVKTHEVRSHDQPIYDCNICHMTFCDESKRDDHVKTHEVRSHSQSIYDCSVCHMTFHDESNRDDHLKTHEIRSHDQPIYDCNICHMTFHDESKRDDHVKTHEIRSHSQSIYDCSICHMTFHDESKRNDHFNNHKFRCHRCASSGIDYESYDHLQAHLQSCHITPGPRRRWPCSMCRGFYATKAERNIHLRDAHERWCEKCDVTFARADGYRRHAEEKETRCRFCCREFWSLDDLERHQQLLHSEGVDKPSKLNYLQDTTPCSVRLVRLDENNSHLSHRDKKLISHHMDVESNSDAESDSAVTPVVEKENENASKTLHPENEIDSAMTPVVEKENTNIILPPENENHSKSLPPVKLEPPYALPPRPVMKSEVLVEEPVAMKTEVDPVTLNETMEEPSSIRINSIDDSGCGSRWKGLVEEPSSIGIEPHEDSASELVTSWKGLVPSPIRINPIDDSGSGTRWKGLVEEPSSIQNDDDRSLEHGSRWEGLVEKPPTIRVKSFDNLTLGYRSKSKGSIVEPSSMNIDDSNSSSATKMDGSFEKSSTMKMEIDRSNGNTTVQDQRDDVVAFNDESVSNDEKNPPVEETFEPERSEPPSADSEDPGLFIYSVASRDDCAPPEQPAPTNQQTKRRRKSDKLFYCEYCPRSYGTVKSMVLHMKTHGVFPQTDKNKPKFSNNFVENHKNSTSNVGERDSRYLNTFIDFCKNRSGDIPFKVQNEGRPTAELMNRSESMAKNAFNRGTLPQFSNNTDGSNFPGIPINNNPNFSNNRPTGNVFPTSPSTLVNNRSNFIYPTNVNPHLTNTTANSIQNSNTGHLNTTVSPKRRTKISINGRSFYPNAVANAANNISSDFSITSVRPVSNKSVLLSAPVMGPSYTSNNPNTIMQGILNAPVISNISNNTNSNVPGFYSGPVISGISGNTNSISSNYLSAPIDGNPQFSHNMGNTFVTYPTTSINIRPNLNYSTNIVYIDPNRSVIPNSTPKSNAAVQTTKSPKKIRPLNPKPNISHVVKGVSSELLNASGYPETASNTSNTFVTYPPASMNNNPNLNNPPNVLYIDPNRAPNSIQNTDPQYFQAVINNPNTSISTKKISKSTVNNRSFNLEATIDRVSKGQFKPAYKPVFGSPQFTVNIGNTHHNIDNPPEVVYIDSDSHSSNVTQNSESGNLNTIVITPNNTVVISNPSVSNSESAQIVESNSGLNMGPVFTFANSGSNIPSFIVNDQNAQTNKQVPQTLVITNPNAPTNIEVSQTSGGNSGLHMGPIFTISNNSSNNPSIIVNDPNTPTNIEVPQTVVINNSIPPNNTVVITNPNAPNNTQLEVPQTESSSEFHMGPIFTLSDSGSNIPTSIVTDFEKISDPSNVFKCNHCDLQFTKNFEYRKHLWAHTINQFTCNICDAEFETKEELKCHSESHSSDPLFCERCDAHFKDNYEFRQHLWRHIERTHKCGQCGKEFENKTDLKTHEKRHQLFKCQVCGLAFTDYEALCSHTKKHPSLNWCSMCKYYFKTIEELNSHKCPKKLSFKCIECDVETDSNDEFKSHKCVKKLSFKCDKCDVETDSIEELKTHRKSHLSNLYECNTCNERFESNESLRSHRWTHIYAK